MANTTIPQLPFLIAIGGGEQLEVVLGGTSYRITTGQIALLSQGQVTGSVTHAQVVYALADPSNPAGANIYTEIVDAIDPAAVNTASAQWIGGARMQIGDALYTLIQSTTGWTNIQMLAFFILAELKPL